MQTHNTLVQALHCIDWIKPTLTISRALGALDRYAGCPKDAAPGVLDYFGPMTVFFVSCACMPGRSTNPLRIAVGRIEGHA